MLPPGPTDNCVACLKPLTAEERHYYEYRCEACEGKWFERVAAWRNGGADAELDGYFGDKSE